MTDNRIFPFDKVEGITDHDEALEKAIKSSDKCYVETAVAGTLAIISKKELRALLNDSTSDNWKVIYFAGFRSCRLYPRGENDDKLEIYAPTGWIEQNFNLFLP